MSGVASSDEGEKAFFESERSDSAAAFARLDTSGVTFGATGPGSLGEKDTASTCERLIRALNARGMTWVVPGADGTGDVDYQTSDSITGHRLSMQVVRAIVDGKFWKRLSQSGASTMTTTLREAADLLMDAIRVKHRIPPLQRPQLTLVLDANRAPAVAFKAVVEEFERRHATSVRALGFAAVYVVGPDDGLVKRLA